MIICNGINFKWYFNGAASAVFTREEERLSDTTTADPLWHSSARIWYKVSQETSKKAWDALQILIKQSCYALLVEVTLCSFYCILMKLKRRPLGLITYFFKICLKQQPYNWMFEQETSLKHNVKKGHKPTRWRTRARHEGSSYWVGQRPEGRCTGQGSCGTQRHAESKQSHHQSPVRRWN